VSDPRNARHEYTSDDWAKKRGYELATSFGDTQEERMAQADDITQALMALRDHCEANRRVQPASNADAGQREALAEYAHEAWSGWMKYMFEKGERRGVFNIHAVGGIDVEWIMPAWAVERWTRQMRTPYADLPEAEKESDRAEADKMLAICRLTASPQPPAPQAMTPEKPLVWIATKERTFALEELLGKCVRMSPEWTMGMSLVQEMIDKVDALD
jgi:hypothetical protein